MWILCFSDDKGVTIAVRYILPHVQHRKSSSASLHRFCVSYSLRWVGSFSIRRRFPLLDPTLKLFQTYRNRRSRCRIFLRRTYIRTFVLLAVLRPRARHSKSRQRVFSRHYFNDEITPFSGFNAAIKRHPYLKFFPSVIVRSGRNAGATLAITIARRVTASPRISDRKFIVIPHVEMMYKRD